MTTSAWNHMDVQKPEVGQLIEWPEPMGDGIDRGIYGADGWCTPVDGVAWARAKPARWRTTLLKEPNRA